MQLHVHVDERAMKPMVDPQSCRFANFNRTARTFSLWEICEEIIVPEAAAKCVTIVDGTLRHLL